MHCGDLNERKILKGGDIYVCVCVCVCVCVADSFCSAVEASTTF